MESLILIDVGWMEHFCPSNLQAHGSSFLATYFLALCELSNLKGLPPSGYHFLLLAVP